MEAHFQHTIEVPRTVARALEIDKETGTALWKDALKDAWQKEMEMGNLVEVTTTWRDAISKFIEWLGWFPDVSCRY